MYRIERTQQFAHWLDGLRDQRAQFKIAQRLLRLEGGNPGDCKALGDQVSEMRIDYGPGYRIYFTVRGRVVYVLLSGSTKADQAKAIQMAKEMAKLI